MAIKTKKKLYLDENVVRTVGAQVVVVTIIILYKQFYLLALLLSVDFFLRAFTPWPSLLSLIARGIKKLFSLNPKPIFAPPKRFAALLGLIFSATITLLLYLGFIKAAYIVGGILIFCAFLESAFNICLGCYVYNLVILPVKRKFVSKSVDN